MPNDDLGTFPMPPSTPTASSGNDAPIITPSDAPTPQPVTPSPDPVPVPDLSQTVSEPDQKPIQFEPLATSEPATPPPLGTIPTVTPTETDSNILYSSTIPTEPEQTPPTSSNIPQETPNTPEPELPSFEETPDEIPSVPQNQPTTDSFPIMTNEEKPAESSATLDTEHEKLVQANETLYEKQITSTLPGETGPEPQFQPEPTTPAADAPATLPAKAGRSLAPIIIIVLLIVASTGLAAAVFLSAQSSKLKTQLEEITQTLEKQKTTLTPTATPTEFEIPIPSIPTDATPTATPTVTLTPTISPVTDTLLPLKNSPTALKVAIGHSPNAQLILIKIDNATNPETAVTKYFFREDLTTKTYFYVSITGKGTPEIIDKQIYVTPDDNIPSLNDSVLGDTLGLDLNEAIRLTLAQCTDQTVCTSAPIKAQYIKTGSGIIWQLSVYTKGLTATPLMIQINATTKAIIYKSPEFANK